MQCVSLLCTVQVVEILNGTVDSLLAQVATAAQDVQVSDAIGGLATGGLPHPFAIPDVCTWVA